MNDFGKFMFGVGAIIQRGNSEDILTLKRTQTHSNFNPDKWELLYGRVRQFEELETAVRREIKEETGISQIEIIKVLRIWHFFRGSQEADKEIFGVTFWCRTNEEKVTLSYEHQEYRWCKPDEALSLCSVPGIQSDIKLFSSRSKNNYCIGLSQTNESLEVL